MKMRHLIIMSNN